MEFVVAKEKDLERMCEITKMAKNQLKKMGLDQWQKGYPSREVWIQDIEDGCAYLAVEDGQILGVFAFQTTPDVSYGEINGKWLTDGAYASMHRVCVADESKGRGVAGKMFAQGFLLELIHIPVIFRCRGRLRKLVFWPAERFISRGDAKMEIFGLVLKKFYKA